MRYRFLRYPQGKEKAVTFSYDDGVRADLKFAGIVNQYGIKCTFNYTNAEHLTKEEVLEHILSKGHEIAVHGAQHRAEGLQRPIEVIEDVLSCRKELERRFHMIIRGMAYPDSGIRNMLPGVTYESIREHLKNLDIAYARTLGGDNDLFRLPRDWYAWMPTARHKTPELKEYIDRFLNINVSEQYLSDRYPRLFYLWGHSYEFDADNNWDDLERICESLAGKENIWYATNMEIHDYVEAYNALIYSADGRIIYNPTLYEIWFDIDGTLYSVPPGETMYL